MTTPPADSPLARLTALAASPVDARVALRAPEPLATFNAAGYLRPADVHVATRLGALAGETDPDVWLALALLVRVVRDGSTCLRLAEAHELAPEVVDDPTADDDITGTPGAAAEAGTTADGIAGGAAAGPAGGLPWPEPVRWAVAVAASPLVAAGVLRFEDGLLYLDRYWAEERSVCADLLLRRRTHVPAVDATLLRRGLDEVFPDAGYAEQREAAARLVHAGTGVLTGGPGSGKTTTIAGFLAVLVDQLDDGTGTPPRIALTAPTGKAAARLQEAVADATARFPEHARARLEGLEASTLHRLLGWRPGSRTRFRHDRTNTLPHDVVVVDESSMLSLTLTARLLEALRPTTRLVLVGDADQLASVDAGAVLGDLVGGLGGADDLGTGDTPVDTGSDAGSAEADPGESGRGRGVATIVRLTGSHRYTGAIGELARAVRDGDADTVLDVLRRGEGMRLVDDEDPAPVIRPQLVSHAVAVREAARARDAEGALAALGRHRVLCAHRSGPHGVRTWNRRVESWLTEETGDALYDLMYVGRPLLVTTNDHTLGLYNGDTGVVLAPDEVGAPPTAVLAAAGGTLALAATRLSDVETMHAMTVHKAQGSEADDITVILPPGDSALLTRELLYTAVTRARRSVTLVGDEDTVCAALHRRARRASGLAARLAAGVR
ncbi:exodeoxyribonuclease V subunit alpha [Mobilicoccus pelagius]|uniref:RecBCD enzyme subunit RecD n=1 Tax=Mobilicoccus pelagius NBRC 104925 TaxID=1089455 RepID=H5UMH6_9MICO|nr:exodeoxyribonuclease V subunit alpha [Mobilicoccus pelagius]GAB46934.1 exodeoxyribonuclease V alpha chain [Mobilicoccus pelagius NBRC 104925]